MYIIRVYTYINIHYQYYYSNIIYNIYNIFIFRVKTLKKIDIYLCFLYTIECGREKTHQKKIERGTKKMAKNSKSIKKVLEYAQENGYATLEQYILTNGDKPRTLQEILSYYGENENDSGRYGRMLEVTLRFLLTGKIHRAHPQNASDTRFNGKTIEIKSGAGWLTAANFFSKEHACLYWNSKKRPIARADFIAYVPRYNGKNIDEVRFFTQTDFIELLASFDLIIPKHASPASGGAWGIAIQSYIPNEKFANEKKFYDFTDALYSQGMTMEQFVTAYGAEVDPNA